MSANTEAIRKPVEASMFYPSGSVEHEQLIEQWGNGVRRMFKEAQEWGLPEPEIVEIGMRMRFIVPLAQPHSIKSETKRGRPELRPESRPESQLESLLATKSVIRRPERG